MDTKKKLDRDKAEVRAVCENYRRGMMRERWVYKDKNSHFPSYVNDDKDIC